MQNRCRDELAKHLPVILMSRVLLVRYVWKGRRWWLKCGRSSPVSDGAQIGSAPPPACFTTERHCRWEGRVRRGLRARRHTHTPPDRDTRSRRGRQPLRTPREGRTALWEDRQPHTALHPIIIIRNFFKHFYLGFVQMKQSECVWVSYIQIQEICQAYTQGPKLTLAKHQIRVKMALVSK